MTLPSRMTVIGIKTPGGPEVLVPEERPVPTPGAGEILVKVAAAGVNRPDVRQRQGSYPPPKGAGDIPGLEIAGEIVSVGEGVTRFKLGDKVCALVVAGGYAQYCLAYESHAFKVPPSLTMVEAAAIPETFFTVWQHLMMRSQMKSGEWVLVHGGTSGIGTTAIQLGKAFGHRGDGARRTPCQHRVPARSQGAGQLLPRHDQAADPDRIDFACAADSR